MKIQSLPHHVTLPSLVLAWALVVGSSIPLPAAEPDTGKMMTEAKMKERCEAMQERKLERKAAVRAEDAELTEQLAKMNAAPKDKKIDLLAAVVTRMAERRISRDARNAKLEAEMMKHMMQHMQQGKESMSQCPMMKGMNDMDDKSAGDHKGHPGERK